MMDCKGENFGGRSQNQLTKNQQNTEMQFDTYNEPLNIDYICIWKMCYFKVELNSPVSQNSYI